MLEILASLRIINEAASTSSNSNSSIGIRGSIGYVAPGNIDTSCLLYIIRFS